MTRPLLALAVILAPLLGFEAAAQEPAPGAGVAGSGAPRMRKLDVAKRLLADPATAQRIDGGSNAEAKRLWASARDKVARAEALLRERDIDAAATVLDEALKEIGQARRAVADPEPGRTASRLRYGHRLDSVQSLYASFQRRAREIHADAEEALATALGERITTAKDLAAGDRTEEAAGMLDAVEKDLLLGLNRLLAAESRRSGLHPRAPAEAYQFELARNRSYAELVPVAITHFRPGPEALKRIERDVQENLKLRDQARQHAAGQDYGAATDKLASGISLLQRALAQAGLAPAPNSGE